MTWKSEIVKATAPPAVVEWFDGAPLCTEDRCPQYDGKRCRVMGFAPDLHCDPVVVAMSALIDEQTARIVELESAWHATTMDRKDAVIAAQEQENDRLKARLAAQETA